jgi:hypothetical protein
MFFMFPNLLGKLLTVKVLQNFDRILASNTFLMEIPTRQVAHVNLPSLIVQHVCLLLCMKNFIS